MTDVLQTRTCLCLMHVALGQKWPENDQGPCGKTVCTSEEVCELDEGGGTCYNSSLRTDCSDGLSYCYRPTVCCGVRTCCPAFSKCCGLSTCCHEDAVCCQPNTCCEPGSICCLFSCCSAGSVCDGSICRRASVYNTGFRWYYLVCVVIPLIVICIVIARRRRRDAKLRAEGLSQSSGTYDVILSNQTNSTNPVTAGYDQPPPYQYPPQGIPLSPDSSARVTLCDPRTHTGNEHILTTSQSYHEVLNPQA
ncbi:hypothetical protein MAR_010049 [Mya arenaria]|uniref:Uncharacterized protein n=1 Tax=Mya arenaria TaxID=6604 RepID=A0ABY7E8L2_MYAAR|nr:hypothetical protein MAR_010049 [Mya arenaria]